MKPKLRYFCILLALFAGIHRAAAQGTTAFTYQGQLHDNGTNANGAYTMTFKLYDAVSNGNQIGNAITTSPILVNGLFSANLDFGNVFSGAGRWLDINVAGDTLTPRVQVLPAPYAQFAAIAATVTNHAIMNVQLANNAVATTNIQDASVTDTKIVSVSGSKVSGSVALANFATNAGSSISALSAATAGSAATAMSLTNGIWSSGVINVSGDSVFYIGIPGTGSSGLSLHSNGQVAHVANGIGISNNGGEITGDGNGGLKIYDGNSVLTVDNMSIVGGNGNSGTINFGGGSGGDTVSLTYGYPNSLTISEDLVVNGTIYGTLNQSSDRNLKEKLVSIDSREILERVANLPISNWKYKKDEDTRHIGPMAQDFYTAFNVGSDNKHIATVDEGGVALAAIQGLNEKLKEKDAEFQRLKSQNESLEKRLADLEQLVKASAQK
ncbi:MAG TPA: tail fiber domain-containing protein [Candidatus Acidoferrales bacterium]|jgi:hypothetical protein|nr:tail fiber domain-containing protein [Candidatus Acidoferrales bacterium]